jgi:DNA-directed RNA polymerase specialized sigma24 family protein
MAKLEDEQLVVLVQECGYVPARDELISRCNDLKDGLVHRRAARSGLQEADRLDAQQDAVLWILEAIREYNTGQHVIPRGCRFRTFLYRVLLSRFIDLLRRQRRRQTRLRLGGYTFGSLSLPLAPSAMAARRAPRARAGSPSAGWSGTS